MDVIDDILISTSIFLVFINAYLYTRSYIRLTSSIALRYFSLYLIVSFIIMASSTVMANKSINNLYLSHYYFVLQFVLLSLFYKALFYKHQKKIVNYFLIGILSILIIQYILNPGLYFKFNLFEIFITSLPIIVYSIVHLYNSLSKKGEYMFINSGVLVYLTTSTLIFILGNYIAFADNGSITYIWTINKILYLVYLILILVEWRTRNLQAKSKS